MATINVFCSREMVCPPSINFSLTLVIEHVPTLIEHWWLKVLVDVH